jgi:hypothetical protein
MSSPLTVEADRITDARADRVGIADMRRPRANHRLETTSPVGSVA